MKAFVSPICPSFCFRPFLLVLVLTSLFFNCIGSKDKSILKQEESYSKSDQLEDSDQIITLKAVGDTIPGTNYPENKLIDDETKLFSGIQEFLSGSDILFGNFESTLTDFPKSAKDVSRPNTYAFRSPPSYAKLLKSVGFHVLSVVNNHSYDFTEAGFVDTMNHLTAQNILAVGGKGTIQYIQIKNRKFAFVGFSYQTYHNSITRMEESEALVTTAVANADIVVLSIHAGAEANAIHTPDAEEIFLGENRGNMVKFSHRMIDLGADLVLGHGPHVPRGMELYKDRLIAYSLGNFLGYRTLSVKGDNGLSLVLDIAINQEGKFYTGRILPVIMESPGIPFPDKSKRSIKLIRELTRVDFPNSPLQIDEEGILSRRADIAYWIHSEE